VSGTPLTLARHEEAERRGHDVLQALLSTAQDAAGDVWRGAALGGRYGHGEGWIAGVGPELADPFELVVVVNVPLREVGPLQKRVRRAARETARVRQVAAIVDVFAAESLPFLPATLEVKEALSAANVVDGPADLLAPARCPDDTPARLEALRLLVRHGASLLARERALDQSGEGDTVTRARFAVRDLDLALGEALLLSAGAWTPGDGARAAALRHLASGSAAATGFQRHMTWTRFHDLVERHRRALYERARSGAEAPSAIGEARKEVARAADRFMEVLRLSEEERLGEPLPSWSAYARALAKRRPARGAMLFASDSNELTDLLSRKGSKTWPAAERLAPALAALLDWDPGDLPLAPLLLDLPDDASRDALRVRAVSLSADV